MFGLFNESDLKRFGFFAGLVLGAAVITTLIYWGIFGFSKWNRQVQTASDLMLSAAVSPVVQLVQPPCLPGTQAAGQYVCSQHGAVGLPNWSAAGAPLCPICGQPMTFRQAGGNRNLTLAA